MNTRKVVFDQKVIEDWLKLIDSTPIQVEVEGEKSMWHLEFDYPVKSPQRMHIVCPADRPYQVLILNGLNISAEHTKAFDELPANEQRDFSLLLRQELTDSEYDFKLEGLNGTSRCPTSIQFSRTHYADGLTMDTFFKSIGSVFKAKLNAIIYFNLNLQGPDVSGNRFDFKTLSN